VTTSIHPDDACVAGMDGRHLDAAAAAKDPLHVDVHAYQGPIEVLLELISRRKLEIDEISVAQVVDDFLAVVSDLGELPLEAASKFLLVAATLIAIKTNRLLPAEDEIELDEDLLADTERDRLLVRLLAARTFKDVAAVLADHLDVGSRFVPRAVQPEEHLCRVAPDVLSQVSLDDLASIAAKVLSGEPPPEIDLAHVQPVRATVREAVDEICTVLVTYGQAGFRSLCRDGTLIEAVVRFLAMLELLKAGFIAAEQPSSFDDIELRWIAPEGHRYVHREDEWEPSFEDRAPVHIDLTGHDASLPQRSQGVAR